MSDREPMTTINGERMTWAAALEAEGLPYDPRLAARALDYHDLRKMTREMEAPPALPVYTGPPPATLEEGIALMNGIGSKWSALSEETNAAILAHQAEAIADAEPGPVDQAPDPEDEIRRFAAVATTREDIAKLRAMQDRAAAALADEVKTAHTAGMKYYRDGLIERYGPEIGADVAAELIDRTVAEIDAEAAETAETVADLARLEALAAEDPEPVPAPLPIVANGRDLGDITADALRALEKWNRRARLFIRAGIPTRIGRDEDGRPMMQTATDSMIRHDLARAARFQRHEPVFKKGEDGKPILIDTRIIAVSPPIDMVKDLMVVPDLAARLPPLRLILEAPTLAPDGRLISTPGYDRESGFYYAPAPGLVLPEIPENPTPDQVRAAALLVYEVIQDFPFIATKPVKGEAREDHASEANAIATLITPVLRGMISGPVPLALIDKPQAGTGASLLAEAIALVATGTSASMMTVPKSDEEWEKKILGILLAGRAVVVFDNVEGRLYAPALASCLTSDYYEGRILGRSEMASVPQRATWIATGVNIQLSGDLPRRCYWVRMDAQSPRPWLRSSTFKHPDLKGWVLEARGEILAAILTLARAWVRAGRPAPKSPILGGYEAWSKTIGGILETAGIRDFLGNLEDLYSETDADAPEWGAFLERLSTEFQVDSGVFTVNSLTARIKDGTDQTLEDSLLGVLPEDIASAWGRPASFSRTLGNALRHRLGMRFTNGYYLVREKDTVKRAVQWRVKYDEKSDLTRGPDRER